MEHQLPSQPEQKIIVSIPYAMRSSETATSTLRYLYRVIEEKRRRLERQGVRLIQRHIDITGCLVVTATCTVDTDREQPQRTEIRNTLREILEECVGPR